MTDNDKDLQRFQKDVEFYEANFEELLRRHPNQWIAVYNQEVVATSPDLDDLFDELKSNKLPIGEVYIEYANPEEEVWIFAAA